MIKKEKIRTAGIIAIGNELLEGIVLESNSNWMERHLVTLGLEVRRLASVRDEIEEIGHAVDFVREECDVIITSGGLGPTHDDMTLKAIATYLGKKLVENPEAIKIIKRQYKTLHGEEIVQSPDMTESRRKMAQLPEGSQALDNRVGGAPGVMIQDNDTTIFCLPGVPSELMFIFEDSLIPWLRENVSQKFHEKVIEFGFRDESVFSPAIDTVMRKVPGVWIKSMPKTYGTSKTLRVWISARGENDSELDSLVQRAITELEKTIGIQSTQVES
ncbi:MAG: competence/damage-inducible protein A [Candidatus Thorarchaeota archaeon]|jgi:molybdenum cofactor synthesis domain-containing protein